MNNIELVKERIEESIRLKQNILENDAIIKQIVDVSDILNDAIKRGGKIFFCGNGGSASDAIHLTAELVGRFQKERESMAAICLNSNVASITAIANDYGYDQIFSRQIEGIADIPDVLFALSTSGASENIYKAILAANHKKMKTIALLGKDGGKVNKIADYPIIIPCNTTARIQEVHIMIGHIICEFLEISK